MKTPNVIAFVSSNTSGTGRLFLEKAAETGLRPLFMAQDLNRFPWVSQTGAEVATIDVTNPEAVVAFLRGRRAEIAAVMTSSEYFLHTAAVAARAIGLTGPDPDAIACCRDKGRQRRAFARAGIHQPSFYEASNPAEAAEALTALGGTAVIKPVDGTGSLGVRLARGQAAIDFAASLLSRHTNERGIPAAGRILLEKFVDGPEFSIEMFDGVAVGVTQKFLGEKPYFVEIGHTFPAPLDKWERQELVNTAQHAAEALGLTFGPLHIEARLVGGRAAIIEVNARLAGGFIPRLMELTGIDLIVRSIAAAARIAPPPDPAPRGKAAAIRFILAPAGGILRVIEGLERCQGMPGIAEAMAYAAPESRVDRTGDFRDRIGHVIGIGESPGDAARNADTALALIRVELHGAPVAVTVTVPQVRQGGVQ